jgi:hypothetical protein
MVARRTYRGVNDNPADDRGVDANEVRQEDRVHASAIAQPTSDRHGSSSGSGSGGRGSDDGAGHK